MFNAKANLILSVVTANVVGVGLFLAAYHPYNYPPEIPAATTVADPPFLPEACSWRQ